jgi:hypothetical protein
MESLLQLMMRGTGTGTHREIYTEFINLVIKPAATAASATVASSKEWSLSSFGDDFEIDYQVVETLAWQLALQLQALEASGWTLLFWQASDILIVNQGEFYLLANLSQLVPLDKKDKSQLFLVYPTVYPLPAALCAPELFQMASLPFITQRSASYYSLGLLCLSLLKNINLSLERIQGTKLFYFIERCMKLEPCKRMCLFL